MTSKEYSLNSSGTSAIDNSLKAPVLVYMLSGLKWLIFASVLGYLASWKSHNQEFLNSWEFLTTGRVQAVYTASFVYGFGCNLAFATGIWLTSRLSGVAIRYNLVLIIAAVFWNVALTIGVVGIFMGDLQVFEYLELPSYVGFPLLVSSLVVSVWGLICIKERTQPDLYVSQWFLVAAFLSFPWIQIVAQVMLVVNPVPGVVQALVANWFAGNLVWLWFGGIAVAGLYYLIPKELGTALQGYSLAKFAFLIMVFAGTWSGVARLVGGPYPAWILTAGIGASILMLIFFSITAINFLGTLWQNCSKVFDNGGVLLFAGFASLALLVSGVGVALLSLRGVAEVSQFTILLEAHRFLILYGVFSMTMFALIYHMLPKILGRDWPMDFLVNSHFWIAFVGIVLVVVPLTVGGWKQGSAMLDASIPISEIVQTTSYFMVARSMAWIFLTLSHLALILNVFLILKPDCDSFIEELTRTDPEPGEGVES
jgi:cytochrome c oxidase cbb3-type subunit 1